MKRVKFKNNEYWGIPFDFKKWKEGNYSKIIARDFEVTNLKEDGIMLSGLVDGEWLRFYQSNGQQESPRFYSHSYDLCILLESAETEIKWCNVLYENRYYKVGDISQLFNTREEADNYAEEFKTTMHRIGLFKITYTKGKEPVFEFILTNDK